jgi:hypothetical protein
MMIQVNLVVTINVLAFILFDVRQVGRSIVEPLLH